MGDLIWKNNAIDALTGWETDPTDKEIEVAICNIEPVDAIPIEWLEKKREQMIDAAQNAPEQAIAYVLWMWKRAKLYE